jgi:toxin CcdB
VKQFDVFDNPISRARRDFPFVAILQSEVANTGRDRIVAPLVPRKRMAKLAGRLTPVVSVAGVEHVLLVPRMTSVAAADLRITKAQLTIYRDAIVSAIDFLFLGV